MAEPRGCLIEGGSRRISEGALIVEDLRPRADGGTTIVSPYGGYVKPKVLQEGM